MAGYEATSRLPLQRQSSWACPLKGWTLSWPKPSAAELVNGILLLNIPFDTYVVNTYWQVFVRSYEPGTVDLGSFPTDLHNTNLETCSHYAPLLRLACLMTSLVPRPSLLPLAETVWRPKSERLFHPLTFQAKNAITVWENGDVRVFGQS